MIAWSKNGLFPSRRDRLLLDDYRKTYLTSCGAGNALLERKDRERTMVNRMALINVSLVLSMSMGSSFLSLNILCLSCRHFFYMQLRAYSPLRRLSDPTVYSPSVS